jgi:outer membrane receptor protein involved in Fe transport
MKIQTALKYLIILLITLESKAVEPETLQSVDGATEKTTPKAAPAEGKKQDLKPATNSEAEAEDEEIFVLGDFVVSAEEDRGYFSASTTSATRTNALIKNTPISVTVINEQLMEDLNVLNDQDLARLTSGVTLDPDGYSFNRLRIRGFRSLTQRYDLFWREIERDGYNIQRVDIVKGANSLIYGQADPGGQINSVPKLAQQGKSFRSFKGMVGNKEYRRAEIDFNQVINDKVAVRLMGFDSYRELDQLYEKIDLRGATIEASYRPFKNTQLRMHLEHIDLSQNLQPGSFLDATGTLRYATNSTDSETDIMPRASLTAYRNEFLFNPEAVQYLPQEIIEDLELVGNANPKREDIQALYSPWGPKDALFSSAGPDKYNDREGFITTIDWTQQIGDSLQAKVAINREDDDRKALSREGYSNSRVKGAVGSEYIETHWQKQNGRTESNALKATLLWETAVENDIFFLDGSKHNFLLGVDVDHLKKNPKIYEQVNDTALSDAAANNGLYYGSDLYKEQLPLANGFGPEAPNIHFNNENDRFLLKSEADSDILTQSLWMAIQSEFLSGRLRSLAGLRYDKIEVEHSYNEYKISVGKNFLNKPKNANLTINDLVTQFDDNKVDFDQVSPTLGALFWINDKIAIYGNYAQSIQSPAGVDVDPFGDIIPPVYGEGYEYGLRFDLLENKLSGQVSAFYIEKENDDVVNYDYRLGDIITYDKYGALYPHYFDKDNELINDVLPSKRVAGDISRSEGVEVEFYCNPNRNISFTFSYTYNNLDAIKINEAVNPRFGRIFGLAPHNAILIGRYSFRDGALKGFSLGGNQRFRSASTMASFYIDDNQTWYDVDFDPEYATDLFCNYETKLGRGRGAAKLNLGFKVQNVFDNRDLVNRNRTGFYRESRQFLVSAKIIF